MELKISVGVSNRHIHLCKEDFDKLFGNSEFYSVKDLSQDGDFASNLVVSVKTSKNVIHNVRVVGPLRDRTQVEISMTDSYFLGINPPVRMSGDFRDACDVILCSSNVEINSPNSCILANRHIHINTIEQEKYNLFDGDKVKALIQGDRGGVLNNVIVKSRDNYNLELHLDTDEANAMGVRNGDVIDIIVDKGE